MAIAIAAWALLVPPFAVPDEAEHAAYVQSLAENGERPPPLRLEFPSYSTEGRAARAAVRNTRYNFDLSFKTPWEPSAERSWHEYERALPRDDLRSVGPQARNPPLYYAYEVAPYGALSGSDFFARMLAMRLWSGLLMLVTVTGAWLLIGELTRRDRLLQLAGASCVGFQPMATFVSAGVNPDALLFASFSVAFWLMARVVVRGPSRAAVAGLIVATLAAVLTKAAGMALVPAVVLALGVAAHNRGVRPRVVAAGVAALGAVVAAGAWAERGAGGRTPLDLRLDVVRGFLTYLWDFYLPRLSFQHHYTSLPGDAWETLLVRQTWAAFGFLEIRFPERVYDLLAVVPVVVLVALVAALARRRFTPGGVVLALFGLTAACLFVGLHWFDFQSVRDGQPPIIQGRYLLPLMPIVGVAVAGALTNFDRARAHAAALVVGGMVVLQFFSLAVVAGRFYA